MSQSPAQFAVRTMRTLEVLTFTPTTAPRVAEALGVHPRTARRLLSQLQRDGWLSYNPRPPHVYAPTLRMVALAAHIGARAPVATVTAPAVERLRADTGLDALLAIPSYDATVCLVHCCGEFAAQPPLGDVTPAHCTATGKVLMAHRDAWRRSILAAPLAACTDRSLTDPAALERELTRVRLDGYATEDGEHLDGVRQLAAPVTGPGGEVLERSPSQSTTRAHSTSSHPRYDTPHEPRRRRSPTRPSATRCTVASSTGCSRHTASRP